MKNVIENSATNGHKVEPYHFKVLGGSKVVQSSEDDVTSSVKESNKETKDELNTLSKPEVVVQVDEQQNKFIEELLKKSDELSTNIVKLQMQIEKQEEDFNNRLKNELERESKNAYERGYQKAKDDLELGLKEIKEKFLDSINTLDLEIKKGNDFLYKIEEELSSTAIEIAKEVIAKEVKESSSIIANTLAKILIKELKDAKNIKLKVNPKDFKAFKEIYSESENIKVDADSAITEGGVVVLSDAGNLDGSIQTRLEKVKNLVDNG